MSLIHKLPYEWLVGLRYTRAGKRSSRNSFISFISLISVSGIALGVAALIVVLSVMNGFQKEVTDRMLSVLAHIEVFDATGSMPNWRQAEQEAFRNPAVRGAAPFVETQGLLVREDTMKPAVIRGILPAEEHKVSDVAKQIRQGSIDSLKSGEYNIVIRPSKPLPTVAQVTFEGNQVLAQASAVAAIGLRPCDARQPRAIHCGFPGDRLLQRRRRERGAVTAKVRRQVGAKPATHRLPIGITG